MQTIRTFVAIPVNIKPVQKAYSELKSALQNSKIKWVDENIMHLTLQFIGDTPVEAVNRISEIIKSSSWESTDIEFEGLDFFGSNYAPKVLFVKTAPNIVLQKLHAYIHDNVGKIIPLKEENREFVPHLTLGRIKYIKQKTEFHRIIKEYGTAFKFSSPLSKIVFYKSTLTPQGPVYEVIEERRV